MSRGKEYKGQTLVIDGSKSGASVVISRLAYDSAFNLEFSGEARYGSQNSDQHWYIEKLSYDSAFNLVSIETAQNSRLLGSTGVLVVADNVVTIPTDTFISDLSVDDTLNNLRIVSISGQDITLSGPLGTTDPTLVTVVLENYVTKDFNKRAWDLRELYIYA